MGRWEPNTKERLVQAALALFLEQGYEATTVAEIAERAGGLTKTTFFRHFPDKREVLFAAGQEVHGQIVTDAIAAAASTATPLAMVGQALDALAATFGEERRHIGAGLRKVIADNPELRERSALKRAALAEAMTVALHRRDVPEPGASLAADLGTRAFFSAFDRWADLANRDKLTELARHDFAQLRTALATLE